MVLDWLIDWWVRTLLWLWIILLSLLIYWWSIGVSHTIFDLPSWILYWILLNNFKMLLDWLIDWWIRTLLWLWIILLSLLIYWWSIGVCNISVGFINYNVYLLYLVDSLRPEFFPSSSLMVWLIDLLWLI